jgi:hypothetical protein
MKELIGHIPEIDSGFPAIMRKHQGWWRAFVLNLEEGTYSKENKNVCNRINNGKEDAHQKNYLSKDILRAVQEAQEKQKKLGKGIMEEDRLYNNLLSSQPLAFNFFGWFHANQEVAVSFLKTIRPDIISVEKILFEYAPETSADGSAFDVAFLVRTKTQRGFIGFEVKYTDTFSFKRDKSLYYYGESGDQNFENYHPIFKANSHRFKADYETYVRSRDFNQLFRNEILGCLKLKEHDINFVITGLFCHQDDKASGKGIEFQKLIGNGIDNFVVITYQDYIERMQKLELSWEDRELVMMLWARYCGLNLSKNILVNEKK